MTYNRRFLLVLPSVLAVATAALPTQAGKLDRAGERTREDDSDDDEDDEDDDDHHSSTSSGNFSLRDDDDNECGELCTGLLYWFFGAPWTVPYEVLHEEPHPRFGYARYPYQGGHGYLRPWLEAEDAEPEDEALVEREPRHPTELPSGARQFALSSALEAGTDFEGVHRGALHLRLWMPVPVEAEARVMTFVEQDTPASSGTDAASPTTIPDSGTQTDWSTLTTIGFAWRFAESRGAAFRTGIAYQHWYEDAESNGQQLSSEERSQPGFRIHYGFDTFPVQPLIFAGDASLGVIGEAGTWELRGSLGANLGPVELYAGYHLFNIGGVSLGGPLAGLNGYW